MSGPVAVSVGDPAGVGPEISVRAAVGLAQEVPSVLFGDAGWLARRVVDADGTPSRLPSAEQAGALAPGHVGLVHVAEWPESVVEAHAPTAAGGRLQLAALDAAAEATARGHLRALVTGPVSKLAVARSGTPFVGQTEHLARMASLADDAVSMLFLGPRLRVGLVTTHLAVRDVADAVTTEGVARTARHLAEASLRLLQRRPVRLVIAGLNPHAGESGLFGDEEGQVIEPALEAVARLSMVVDGAVELVGLMPAETAFRLAGTGRLDAVVAMYHDQATIASKLLDFGAAANVTWGLPFVRTSVDHGVAYDAARAGGADPAGMFAAMKIASSLVRR